MVFFGSFLIFAWLIRLWLSGFAGIHPTEAYLWLLSQNLKPFYSDVSPMIVHWIRWGQELIGLLVSPATQDISQIFWMKIGLRLVPSFVASVLVPLIIGRCVEWAQKSPLRITQMILLGTTPVFLLGPQVVSEWIPLFLFWSLGMVIALRLIRTKRQEAFQGDPTPFRPAWAIFFGLSLGLAFFSHPWAPGIFVLFVLSGAGIANSLLAAGVSSLFVLWQHLTLPDGISSNLVQWLPRVWLAHTHDPATGVPLKHLGDLWFTQFLLWSPFVFLGACYFPFRDLRNFFAAQSKSLLSGVLSLWCWMPLLALSLVSLRTHQAMPWATPCVLGAFVLVAARLKNDPGKMFWIILTHLGLIVFAGVIFLKGSQVAHFFEERAPRLADRLRAPSRLSEFSGWKRFHTLAFEFTRSANTLPVVVDDIAIFSQLAFFDRSEKEDRFSGRLRLDSAAKAHSALRFMDAIQGWDWSNPSSDGFWYIQSRSGDKVQRGSFVCGRPQEFARDAEARITYRLHKCLPLPK